MLKIIVFLLLFISSVTQARGIQDIELTSKPDSSKLKNWFLVTEYMQMHSTHGTNYRGGTLMFGYRSSSYISYGLGIKYAYTNYHFDNGWYLHYLNFLPVFADVRLNFVKNRMITPYFHLSTGITFINYRKEDKYTMGHPYTVREEGLYFNSGFGVVVKIGKHFAPILDAGFQGFQMSFNQLAVNPHGLTVQIGVVW